MEVGVWIHVIQGTLCLIVSNFVPFQDSYGESLKADTIHTENFRDTCHIGDD